MRPTIELVCGEDQLLQSRESAQFSRDCTWRKKQDRDKRDSYRSGDCCSSISTTQVHEDRETSAPSSDFNLLS